MLPREKIIRDFAEWTAFSATRSGCPIKKKEQVYPLIRIPDYGVLFNGNEFKKDDFENWHEKNTMAICSASILPVGWASKLINIYLKTRVYVGNEGRPGLVKWIHPPIDHGLWNGIMKEYHNDGQIIKRTHRVENIKDIRKYETYKIIIEGCSMIAQKRGCLLIEVEELWQGTEI